MYRLEVAAKLPEDVARVGWKFFDHSQVDEPSHEVPIIVCVWGGGGGRYMYNYTRGHEHEPYLHVCMYKG